jgi:hypothetical protein
MIATKMGSTGKGSMTKALFFQKVEAISQTKITEYITNLLASLPMFKINFSSTINEYSNLKPKERENCQS